MATVLTGNGISYYRLAALKARVKLESFGMKCRGPATTPIARRELGLKARAPHAVVIEALQAKMDEMIAQRAAEVNLQIKEAGL